MFSGKLVRFCSTNGFSQLGVDSILIERLSNQLGITTPTEIQSKVSYSSTKTIIMYTLLHCI